MFKKFSKQPVGVKVAIITTIGAIIIGTFPLITNLIELFNKPEAIPVKITFRVTDISGVSIPQAKLILLSENNVLSPQYTDSSGFAKFSGNISGDLRVFVESRGHEPFDQIIEDFSNTIQIRLEDSKGSVLVRVLDSEKNEPVNGAEVILIVNGNKYSEISDSDGITKFTTGFPTDEIDGDISVSFNGFNIERKKVTLQADRVQDINLNKTTGSLTISFTDPEELPILPTPTTLITVTPKAEACGDAPPKRLKKGDKAIVCTQFETVHLRENPDNTSEFSHRLVPGAELQVIGDAVCDEEASWWYWEVKTEKGFEGWVAEGGDEIDTYFICPFK